MLLPSFKCPPPHRRSPQHFPPLCLQTWSLMFPFPPALIPLTKSLLFPLLFFFPSFVPLRLEPRASYMLDKLSTTELYHWWRLNRWLQLFLCAVLSGKQLCLRKTAGCRHFEVPGLLSHAFFLHRAGQIVGSVPQEYAGLMKTLFFFSWLLVEFFFWHLEPKCRRSMFFQGHFSPKNSYAKFVPYVDSFHTKQLRMLPFVTPVLPSKKKKSKHSEWK